MKKLQLDEGDSRTKLALMNNADFKPGNYKLSVVEVEDHDGRSEVEAPDGRDSELVYMRIADDLERRIKSGELAPGARLLPERDLARYYKAAFHSVRSAIKVLRERGLIETIHGRGNFVTRQGS